MKQKSKVSSKRASQPEPTSRSQCSSRRLQVRANEVASTSSSQPNNRSTQSHLEESFSRSQKLNQENLEELANNLVRYVLYRAGNNQPFRKLDLQKNILKSVGRSFDLILNRATVILKNVYGYDLYLDEEATAKSYLVSNSMPFKVYSEKQPPQDTYKILIMLVLTHVFMSNNASTEASLFLFLRSLKIEPDELHELFGNVKDFVTSTMVKQKYLHAEIDDVTKRVVYSWGFKAEHEISKHSLLKFVCSMYKNQSPKSWTSHFQAANEQVNRGATENEEEEQGEIESD